MWRRRLRVQHVLLLAIAVCALIGLLGPRSLLRTSISPSQLPSECTAAFADEWKQYAASSPGNEAPVCIISPAGTCKSLLAHALLQDCPPAANLRACHRLAHGRTVELSIIVSVSPTASRLVPLVANLLSELQVHAHFLFIVDQLEDSACVAPVTATLKALGIDAHSCSGTACSSSVQAVQGSSILAIQDSLLLTPGSLERLRQAASKLPNSLVSAVIISPSGSIAWGIPPEQGLQRVKQVPPLCLIGSRPRMASLQLWRMGRDAAEGHMWELKGPAFTVGSATARHASGNSIPALPAVQPSQLHPVLYVDTNIPTPDKDSGSKRTSALMALMVEAGLAVTFQPLWPTDAHYAAQLNALGVRTLSPGYPQGWAADPTKYEIVFIARRYTYEQCSEAVRRTWPNARLVYDTVDLHFLREARVKMVGTAFDEKTDLQTQGPQQVIEWLAAGDPAAGEVNGLRETELRFINQSDVSIVVSDQEVQVVKHYLPEAAIRVVSNIMAVDGRATSSEGSTFDFEQRSGLLFVGHMAHYPNQQAVLALVRYIMPELQARRSWRWRGMEPPVLHIVGSGALPQDAAEEVSAAKGVIMHGQLSDPELEFLYAAVRVAVAPLVSGAGVKGKVNQAMALGVPVVATTIAVEGMHAVLGHDCMIAHSLEELVDHIEKVYLDAGLWQRLAHNGRININRHFAPEVASVQLRDVLDLLSIHA